MPRNMCCLFLILTLVLCGQLPTAHAEILDTRLEFNNDGMEALYGDEEFVSIATGSRKPVYKAPAVASVITAKQIKAMGARNLDEVLETVPGLHVVPSSLNRLNSIYSIRGIHTGENPQILVLMNGLPLSFTFSGGRVPNFRLPISAIARIEVIRGPGSAIYGADAFAGVINIITKSADDINGTEIGGRYGSFDSRDIWLQSGQHFGELEVMFSLELQQSDGDTDRTVNADLQTIFDQGFGTNVSHAPGPLNTNYNVLDTHLEFNWNNLKLRSWYWRQEDAGLGPGGAQALDPNSKDDIESYQVDLSWKADDLVPDWGFTATTYYLYHKTETNFLLLPPGATVLIGSDGNIASFAPFVPTNFPDGVIGNPDSVNQQTGVDLAAVYSGATNHRIRLGSGFRYQDVDTSETKNFGPGVTIGTLTNVSNSPFVFMPDSYRKIWYLSLQDEWQFAPDWELTGGVRYDNYSDFGSTVNPRLALVWATRHNLTTKLLYGRAFRAPSFSEQFARNNPVIIGNSDLDPETINTVELAFDYRPTFNIQINLSIFGYQANGLIEYLTDPNGVTKTAQNARDQDGYGLEFEAVWNISSQLRLQGNYSWQHSEDTSTGKRIADAPGQQLLLAADWKIFPQWNLHPQVYWVMNRHRTSDDSRHEIDDYALVDLTLSRANIMKNIDLSLAARNLFDEDAREPSNGIMPNDYPMEGRSLWVELRYRF